MHSTLNNIHTFSKFLLYNFILTIFIDKYSDGSCLAIRIDSLTNIIISINRIISNQMNFKLNILLDLSLGLNNIYLKLCPCGAIWREPMLDLECCSAPCRSWVQFPVATYVKEILSA